VVVPTSLLFNWEREAGKFVPDLSILTYHGPGRHRYNTVLHMADLVLTTYGSLLRDREHLKNVRFHVMMLDEAQAIKNPSSGVARAVRSINARQRIALSGTPVENNLTELWSAFAFVSPGLLGSYSTFSSFYARPIERENCEERAEILRRLTYPFILRRTKEQVATELPPKTETVLYADMLPRQRTLYEVTRELYHGQIAGMIDKEGMEKASMQVLAGLLRLRQISCHPLLADENFEGDSGKFRLLDESLEEIIGGGHRVLVFSQFVRALELLSDRLRRRGIASELLTGKTRNRARVVDTFQNNPSIPVFLISLKAGGVGLNLTSADYVIHLDPWWNPAAEKQASDRAYRIGQKRRVFVYKMITKGSVEERVLALQERKQALIRSVITTESGFFKKLSPEEVLGLFADPSDNGGDGMEEECVGVCSAPGRPRSGGGP
ncbi:MAG: serine/threonine protein kinase, partial [Chitinivibrionales bacterium]|nr:serine/threonine protein kinase [Chitinivibrionales bacterium]MBD3356251.1 serine/threonine protein kinase [Chitinivibrionales bacterium]